MYQTTKALVLREVKYKEADKILTVLTERDGKRTVKARGALRKGCKFGAAAEALCYSEMTLFGSAGKWSINEAETIEQFLPCAPTSDGSRLRAISPRCSKPSATRRARIRSCSSLD